MIAIASRSKRTVLNPRWHRRFLQMLPAIRRYALFCFRNLPQEARDELVQETIANCYVACCRLAQRRRLAAAHPSPLVRYAVSQVRSGRRVGCRLNSHDVLSEYAQRRKGFHVERLDHHDEHGEWRAALVEDHHTPVDDQAAFRIDFPAWLTPAGAPPEANCEVPGRGQLHERCCAPFPAVSPPNQPVAAGIASRLDAVPRGKRYRHTNRSVA